MRRTIVASGIPHRYAPMPSSTSDVQVMAAAHALDRLGHMLEVSIMLALASRLPAMRAGSGGDWSSCGAVLQDRAAGRCDAQAAHVLPCQLRIQGVLPWDLELPEALRLALAARFCVTSVLPRPFNAADREAERSGLCDAFVTAVAHGFRVRATGNATDVVDAIAIRLASQLVHQCKAAFLVAAERKRQRERIESGAVANERLVEALILEAYARGVPCAGALIGRVDWHRNAGRDLPWDPWLQGS